MIDISLVIGKLETACNQAKNLEVSGYGFCRQEDGHLVVYDVVILDVGNGIETNIDPRKPEVAQLLLEMLERPDANNLKLWWHRHPINWWSGTDEVACKKTPMGGDPKHVKWSAAVVRTPQGWIGRLDNHLTGKTKHVPVITGAEDAIDDTSKLVALAFSTGKAYNGFGQRYAREWVEVDDPYEEGAEDLDDELEPELSIIDPQQAYQGTLWEIGEPEEVVTFEDRQEKSEYNWLNWFRKKAGGR